MRKDQTRALGRNSGLVPRILVSGSVLLITLAYGADAYAHRPQNSVITSQFAIADFDHDGTPDYVGVQMGPSSLASSNYQITVRLSNGLSNAMQVMAGAGGLGVLTKDVNNDGYPDLVVTTLWTNEPVALFLNVGHGNFVQLEPDCLPSAFASSEKSLTSSGNHVRSSTAALNGRWIPAPHEQCTRFLASVSATGVNVILQILADSVWQFGSFLGRAPPIATHCL